MDTQSFTSRLLEISRQMVGEHNPQKLLELIMDASVEFSGAREGLLLLVDEKSEFRLHVARNIQKENLEKVQFSRSIAREVARSGQAVFSLNVPEDQKLKEIPSILMLKLMAIVCLPLKIKNKTVGVIYLGTEQPNSLIQRESLPLLQAFADQAATALQNALLFQEKEIYRRKLEKDLSETRQDLEEKEGHLQELKAQVEKRPRQTLYPYERIVGRSKKMEEILKTLDKITNAQVPVFILGETGTGKELLARAIHQNSLRNKAPFVAINCSAFPETILESELFGYYRGAFTGADRDRKGLFEEADGGILFLDEVGDMSLSMQAKLLRAIQEQEVMRLGGRVPVKINVRVISASNKDLKQLVREGKFREDLYFRIAGLTLPLPPLCERKEDLPLLIKHFLEKARRENHFSEECRLGHPAMETLMVYDWPGNIRELEHCLTNACLLAEGKEIQPEHLLLHHDLYKDRPHSSGESTGDSFVFHPTKKLDDYEKEIILKTLEFCNGNKSEAAKRLGLSRLTLHKKAEEYGEKK